MISIIKFRIHLIPQFKYILSLIPGPSYISRRPRDKANINWSVHTVIHSLSSKLHFNIISFVLFL